MKLVLDKKSIAALVGVTAILLVFAATTYYVTEVRKQKMIESSSAGEAFIVEEGVSYTDLDGNEKMLENYIGEVIIVSSWASWSPYSANELHKIGHVASSFENQEIKVVAINRAESAEVAQRYLKHIKQDDNVELILDPDDTYYKSIEGYTMPETVLYDRDGNIYFHKRGEVNEEELTQKIREILAS